LNCSALSGRHPVALVSILLATLLASACAAKKEPKADSKAVPAPLVATDTAAAAPSDHTDVAADLGSKTEDSKDDAAVEVATEVVEAGPPVPVRTVPPAAEELLQCAVRESESVSDLGQRSVLLLGVAAVRAQFDSEAAVTLIKGAPPIPEVTASLEKAVLSLAARDLGAAKRAVAALPSDAHRRHCLAATAKQLVLFDTAKAVRVAEKIDPRIIRESALLDVLHLALEQSVESATVVSDRIIEPLLNDHAAAAIASKEALQDFDRASALVESIESPFVKQWAYLSMLQALAASDPEGALKLERKLTLAHHLDEFHAVVARFLVKDNPDKALTIALRVSDREIRIRTLAEVAGGIFPRKPAFAYHLLLKEAGEQRAQRHLGRYVRDLCAGEGGDLAGVWRALRRKLTAAQGAKLLLECCPHRPQEVRRLATEVPPALVMPLRHCYVCAGVESDPEAVIRVAESSREKDHLHSCMALLLLDSDPAAATKSLAQVKESYVADETRLKMTRMLLEARKTDRVLGLLLEIKDPYMRGQGLLPLLSLQ